MDTLCAAIRTERGAYDSRDHDTAYSIEGDRLRLALRNCIIELTVLRCTDAGLILECTVENVSAAEMRLISVTPIRYDADWASSGLFTVAADSAIDVYPAERCYGYHGPTSIHANTPATSCWFFSTNNRGQEGTFLTGITGPPNGFYRYSCVPMQGARSGRRVLRWACDIDTLSGSRGVRIAPGGTFPTGAFYIGYADTRDDVFQELAQALAEHAIRRHTRTSLAGWCSWYAGYHENISEAECLTNLEAASLFRDLSFFQIDDGWADVAAMRRGVLTECDTRKFPRGMPWLAEQIRAAGLRPGLWLRPFLDSRLNDGARQWFPASCLDLSSAEEHRQLRESFETVCKAWKYSYVKIDFMTYDFYGCWGMELAAPHAAMFAPSDDTVTNIQMYRRGLESVREGAGEDVIINGCNCLIGPAIGIVDILRIGDDIDADNRDRTFTMGVRSISPMLFLNGIVFRNDPDCVFLHGPQSIEQKRAWLLLVTISGGWKTLSSELSAVQDLTDEWEFHNESTHMRFKPFDTWNNPPSFWHWQSGPSESVHEIAVFNWSNAPSIISIPLSRLVGSGASWVVFELYEHRYHGIHAERMEATLPPHSARVYSIRRDRGVPQLIGTDASPFLSPSIEEAGRWIDGDALAVTTRFERPTRMWFHIPAGFRPSLGDTGHMTDDGLLRLLAPAGEFTTHIEFS